MKILVINCGSSSLKFQLIDMKDESVLAKGNVERIGIEGSFLKYQPKDGEKLVKENDIQNHTVAMKMVIDVLLDSKVGVIKSIDEISAVGHRIVHGGEYFLKPTIVDDKAISDLQKCLDLAPLHTAAHLMGIEACKNNMPKTPMVIVVDTSFHQTMPKKAYIYPVPYEMYEKYKIRRYGFHGTSHNYVSSRAATFLKKDIKDLKIISCHLGNGASLCAIQNGKVVDTSMGFTPVAGLAMGSRTGTIDPSVITFIMDKENISPKEMSDYINKKCGVLGISGISSDFRDIENAYFEGNESAKLALDIFVDRVKKFIGSYIAVMNGIDVLIFTAGIGEMSPLVRKMVTENMEFFGIKVDEEKNKVMGKEMDISSPDAKVTTLVIPTNEELMIARETQRIVK